MVADQGLDGNVDLSQLANLDPLYSRSGLSQQSMLSSLSSQFATLPSSLNDLAMSSLLGTSFGADQSLYSKFSSDDELSSNHSCTIN
jgi:hypothetical protein